MSDNDNYQALGRVTDLPLLIEQLQSQLDDLQAIVRAQQAQLDRHSARLTTLERR